MRKTFFCIDSHACGNPVRVVAGGGPLLPHLPVARAVWAPRPSFSTSAECWLAAGGAHHTVLSTAVGVEAFEHFATMTRTELLTIDADTTVRDFQRELRWNAAYHRLAASM